MKISSKQDFSKNGRISLPPAIAWGWSSTDVLADFVSTKSVDKFLVVTDQGLINAGVLEPVLESIKAAQADVEVFDEVKPEPAFDVVSAALEKGWDAKVNGVIGVGGGSSLDVAKIVAVLLVHNTPIADCLGMGNMPGKGLPLVLIPTTTGTGSEVTQVSVLTDESHGGTKKVAYDPALLADLVIVDPYLSMNLPPSITAVTAIDALSHAIEPFVSNRRNVIADMFAKEAISRISHNVREAVLRGANCPEARYNLAIGATIAGLALSCGGAGATHALNYPLSVRFHLGHGDSIARLLPFVMQANLPSDPARYAMLADLMGAVPDGLLMSEREKAEASVSYLVALCQDIGVRTGIRDLVKDDKGFDSWADTALQYSGHNIDNNPRLLNKQEIISIYQQAYEGSAE